MESFVTRSARPRAEAAGGNTHVQNGILEKLRKLRSLDLKSLKLAIEHELKTGLTPVVLTLQANGSATKSECWNFFSRVMESESVFAAGGLARTANPFVFLLCDSWSNPSWQSQLQVQCQRVISLMLAMHLESNEVC